MTLLRSLIHPLGSVVTWRRWIYLVLGGAVLVPYVVVVVPALLIVARRGDVWGVLGVLGLALAAIAAIAATSLLAAVRQVEVVSIRQLVGVPAGERLVPESSSTSDRVRAGLYFVLHLVCGGVIAAASVIAVPNGVALLLGSVGLFDPGEVLGTSSRALFAVAGLFLILATAYGTAGLGAFLATLAPSLLGRSSAERLAEMERFTDELSERNRIARDLHDSLGHALSIVSVQAGAARRVLDHDVELARESLLSVEDAARQAMDDLDAALAVLREDGPAGQRRTLREVETLIRQSEAAGLVIRSELSGPIDRLPEPLSREAFLVIQESLTNVLRHAGPVDVSLRVRAEDLAVRLEVVNELPTTQQASRPSGGRGVRWMSERSYARGGDIDVGEVDGVWRVAVTLPATSQP